MSQTTPTALDRIDNIENYLYNHSSLANTLPPVAWQ
jgi:hypothetical protein